MANPGVSPELALVDPTLRDELVRALPPIELGRPVRPSVGIAVRVAPVAEARRSRPPLLLAGAAYTAATIAEFAVIASAAVAVVTVVVLVLAALG